MNPEAFRFSQTWVQVLPLAVGLAQGQPSSVALAQAVAQVAPGLGGVGAGVGLVGQPTKVNANTKGKNIRRIGYLLDAARNPIMVNPMGMQASFKKVQPDSGKAP